MLRLGQLKYLPAAAGVGYAVGRLFSSPKLSFIPKTASKTKAAGIARLELADEILGLAYEVPAFDKVVKLNANLAQIPNRVFGRNPILRQISKAGMKVAVETAPAIRTIAKSAGLENFGKLYEDTVNYSNDKANKEFKYKPINKAIEGARWVYDPIGKTIDKLTKSIKKARK